MSYAAKGEKIFSYQDPTYPNCTPPGVKRSDHRLKRFHSTFDKRAWNYCEEVRHKHFHELMSGSRTCIGFDPCHRYVPLEDLIRILMAEKDALINELQQQISESSRNQGDAEDKEALQKQIAGLTEEVNKSRDMLRKAMHKLQNIDEIVNENKKLQCRLRCSEERVKYLEEKKKNLESEIADLRSKSQIQMDLEAAQQMLCQVTKEREEAAGMDEAVLQCLALERDELQEKVKQLEKELEESKKKEAEIEMLKKQSHSDSLDKEEMSRENECYRKKLASMKCLEKQIQDLKKQGRALVDKHKKWTEAKKAAEQMNKMCQAAKELQSLREERDSLRKRVDELASYECQYNKLQRKLQRVDAVIAENEKLNCKLVALEKMEKENEYLRCRLEAIQEVEMNAAEDKERIMQLQCAVADQEEEMKDLLCQIERLTSGRNEEELERLRCELYEKNSKLKLCEEQLAEIPMLEAEIDELRMKLQCCCREFPEKKRGENSYQRVEVRFPSTSTGIRANYKTPGEKCSSVIGIRREERVEIKEKHKSCQEIMPPECGRAYKVTSDMNQKKDGMSCEEVQNLLQSSKGIISCVLEDMIEHQKEMEELETCNRAMKEEIETLKARVGGGGKDCLLQEINQLKKELECKNAEIARLKCGGGAQDDQDIETIKELNRQMKAELEAACVGLKQVAELEKMLEKEHAARCAAEMRSGGADPSKLAAKKSTDVGVTAEVEGTTSRGRITEDEDRPENRPEDLRVVPEVRAIAEEDPEFDCCRALQRETDDLKLQIETLNKLTEELKKENELLRELQQPCPDFSKELDEKCALENLLSMLQAELDAFKGQKLSDECEALRTELKRVMEQNCQLKALVDCYRQRLDLEKKSNELNQIRLGGDAEGGAGGAGAGVGVDVGVGVGGVGGAGASGGKGAGGTGQGVDGGPAGKTPTLSPSGRVILSPSEMAKEGKPGDPGSPLGAGRAGTAGAGTGGAGTGAAGTGVDGTGVDGTGVDGTGVAGTGVAGTGAAGTGAAGTGAAGTGVDGTGAAGAGVDGTGVAGTGVAGTGVAGPGVAGPGVAGPGVTGTGVTGTGVAGTGVAGTGVTGTGVAGSGVAGAGADTSGCEDELNALRANLAKLQQENDNLKNSLTEAENRFNLVGQPGELEKDLMKQLEQLKKEKNDMAQQFQAAEGGAGADGKGADPAAMAAAEKEKADCQKELEQLRKEKEDLAKQLQAGGGADAGGKGGADPAAAAAVAAAEKEKADCQKELEQLRKEKDDLAKQLQAEKDGAGGGAGGADPGAVAASEKDKADCLKELEQLRKEKDDLAKQLNEAKAEVVAAAAAGAGAGAGGAGGADPVAVTAAEKDKADCLKELEQLRKEKDDLAKQLNEAKAAEASADKGNADLLKELEQLRKGKDEMGGGAGIGPGAGAGAGAGAGGPGSDDIDARLRQMEAENAEKLRKLMEQHEKELADRDKTYNDNLNAMKSGYETDIRKLAERHKQSIMRLQELHEDEVQEMNLNYETQLETMQTESEAAINDVATGSAAKTRKLAEAHSREMKEAESKFHDALDEKESEYLQALGGLQSTLTRSMQELEALKRKDKKGGDVDQLKAQHAREMQKARRTSKQKLDAVKEKMEEERKKSAAEIESLKAQLKEQGKGEGVCQCKYSKKKPPKIRDPSCPLDFNEVLEKILEEGLDSLTFNEIALVHRKTCCALEGIVMNSGAGTLLELEPPVGDGCPHTPLLEADKQQLLSKIFALENEITQKQKQTQEVIISMEVAIKKERCRLQDVRNTLQNEQQKNLELKSLLTSQTKLHSDLKKEKDRLGNQASMHQSLCQEKSKQLDEEMRSKKYLEAEVHRLRNSLKHMSMTLYAERGNSDYKQGDQIEMMRKKLEQSIHEERRLALQLENETKCRLQLQCQLQTLRQSLKHMVNLPAVESFNGCSQNPLEAKSAKERRNLDQINEKGSKIKTKPPKKNKK